MEFVRMFEILAGTIIESVFGLLRLFWPVILGFFLLVMFLTRDKTKKVETTTYPVEIIAKEKEQNTYGDDEGTSTRIYYVVSCKRLDTGEFLLLDDYKDLYFKVREGEQIMLEETNYLDKHGNIVKTFYYYQSHIKS